MDLLAKNTDHATKNNINIKRIPRNLNIEYYFWWRDQCFWLINSLRHMALLHGQYQ